MPPDSVHDILQRKTDAIIHAIYIEQTGSRDKFQHKLTDNLNANQRNNQTDQHGLGLPQATNMLGTRPLWSAMSTHAGHVNQFATMETY
jgi:hypothetical protein